MRQEGGFLRVLRFTPPIKLTTTIYLNIVENGVKHHSHNLNYDINLKLNNKKKTSFKLIFYLIFIIFHPDYIIT